MAFDLTPERALIFRIVHRDNVSWLLDHGIHCPNSETRYASYIQIGNPDLIDKRSRRELPSPPGGMLSDYAPFYFTPCSPMLMNIKTGYAGMKQRPNEEIVIFVSSLVKVRSLGLRFAFSDRHANLATARFSSDLADLQWINWPKLCTRDFRKDPEHPEWFEQYQAEALIHHFLPTEALIGLACSTENMKSDLTEMIKSKSLSLKVHSTPGWYFQ